MNDSDKNIKDISAQKEAVSKLVESSSLNLDFYLMMVLSSLVVCLGLLLGNIVIVIGGMLITPFLSPLLMLAFAFVTSDLGIIKRSLAIIFKSIVVILGTSFIATLLVPRADVDLTLVNNIASINLSYFYVSLVAGFAAVYAWARPNIASILPGVAITVALLPPLVSVAVALSFFDIPLMVRFIQSSVANILGVLLSATFVFAILGFYRVRNYAKKEIKEIKEIENK